MAYNKFYLACKWQKKPIAYHAFCNLKLSRSRGMIHDRKVSFSEISFQFTLSLSIFSMKVEVIFHQTNCVFSPMFSIILGIWGNFLWLFPWFFRLPQTRNFGGKITGKIQGSEKLMLLSLPTLIKRLLFFITYFLHGIVCHFDFFSSLAVRKSR